jgi:hypothetical protein
LAFAIHQKIPMETEVEGFTVPFPSTSQHKPEYIGATISMVFKDIDCAALLHFVPAFCSQVRKKCVKILIYSLCDD